jgi:hypothetical protein
VETRAGVIAEFTLAEATRPTATEAFDLAYARLVLVAVEDLFLGALHSDPPALALDRLQEVYGETSVEQAARDPSTIFYQARIHQVPGRRPGGSGRA